VDILEDKAVMEFLLKGECKIKEGNNLPCIQKKEQQVSAVAWGGVPSSYFHKG